MRLYFDPNLHVDGAVQSTEDTATIWVKDEPPPSRQRFTVAHELGHLLLHQHGALFRDTHVGTFDRAYDETERQANAFAAALLMPRFLLETGIHYTHLTMRELARLFGVSPQAMEIRLDWIRKGRRDF